MDENSKSQIPKPKKDKIGNLLFEIGPSQPKIAYLVGAGFTLIELLIVIMVMFLLFGLGYANYRDFSRRQALLAVAREVKGDLRYAQGLALGGRKPPGVSCDAPQVLDNYSFDVVAGGNYRIFADCSGGDVLIKDVQLPTNTTMSASSTPIVFKVLGHGTGIPAGGSVTLTLTQAVTGYTQTVTITFGGEIK